MENGWRRTIRNGSFADNALYKLYLIYTPGPGDTADRNPATDFIPELIPALNQAFEAATAETNKSET